MDKETKQAIIKKYAKSDKDVGSVEVQVALLTHRISHLTEHMKQHRKDKHSEHGLIKLVNKRKKFLAYLNRENHEGYLALCKDLKIRH